jgi:drug/metabolite transporter (DMT)-like permease
VQDIDGKMGQIIGVKEWEKKSEKLEKANNKFDVGMLFFQISLVLGAICIIIYDNPKLQKLFIGLMVGCGSTGVAFSIWGYLMSL